MTTGRASGDSSPVHELEHSERFVGGRQGGHNGRRRKGRLYEALGAGTLKDKSTSIEGEYADLHERVSAPLMWASVRDQLRFVLPKYAERTSAAEGKAARALLARLEELAGDNPRG